MPTVAVISTMTSKSDSSTLATGMSEWPLKMMVVLAFVAPAVSGADLFYTLG
jgi:hypothetical protein